MIEAVNATGSSPVAPAGDRVRVGARGLREPPAAGRIGRDDEGDRGRERPDRADQPRAFEFNLYLDQFLLKPVAQGYGEVVPDPIKTGIRNVLNNLREPWTLLNDLAQGDFERAQIAYGRFLLNSTYGVAGIFDVAKEYGLPGHREDFGQTLAVWGIPEGPYLVLPLFGPSNPPRRGRARRAMVR